MILAVRTFDITPSIGGAIAKRHVEALQKALKYAKQKWPEVEATLLVKMFGGGSQSVCTKHESVDASMEWWGTFFQDEEMRSVAKELMEEEEKTGVPSHQRITDTFYRILE